MPRSLAPLVNHNKFHCKRLLSAHVFKIALYSVEDEGNSASKQNLTPNSEENPYTKRLPRPGQQQGLLSNTTQLQLILVAPKALGGAGAHGRACWPT